MLSVKQDSTKYHFFLSLWYDLTWDWTPISWAIGEHFNHYANVRYNKTIIYIYDNKTACLCCLYPILDAHTNYCGHTSCLPPTRCTWTCLLLACHPCNLCSTSAREQPASCLPKETGALYVMPPTQLIQHFCWEMTCVLFTLRNRCTYLMSTLQLMWHVKWIFQSISNMHKKDERTC